MKRGKIIGVDLGGTNLRVGLVQGGKVVKYIKKRTPNTEEGLLKELVDSIRALMDGQVAGVGVASPGPLENGIIKNPPNLALKNFNLKKYLEKKFKKKVVVENDANCVALAEAQLGCKKKNFIILTLGTGIGGGVVIDGKLYRGQGVGGEVGHIILDNGRYFEDIWKEKRNITKKYFGKILLINDLLKLKDKRAKKLLDETVDYLGQGIASLINIFDPEVVVLSGGIKETGSRFLRMIQKQTDKYVILPRKTKIIWTRLKHPGVVGAGLLVS